MTYFLIGLLEFKSSLGFVVDELMINVFEWLDIDVFKVGWLLSSGFLEERIRRRVFLVKLGLYIVLLLFIVVV